jgi:Pro-kumamolisin, activation domain
MITQAIDEANRATLRGNVHPLVRSAEDRGIAPSSMQLDHMLLVLTRSPEQETALETLMAQQLDKSSPNFHKWLTPAQFGQEFGPSDEDIDKVSSWLQSHGFRVNSVANGRTVIDFSGNAGEIQEAFHTEIHHLVVNGQDHWANTSDPQIPVALAPVVLGVERLNDFRPKAFHHNFGAVKMTMPGRKITAINPKPQFTFANNSCGTGSNCYGLGPYDFATIYSLPWATNANPVGAGSGAGETIAIVSDSDINDQDYIQFRSLMGLPAGTVNEPSASPTTGPGVLNKIVVGGPSNNPGIQNCNANSDEQEAIVDVEWSGGAAPGATLDFVIAPSAPNQSCNGTANNPQFSFGGDAAANYIVNNLSTVAALGDSYGLCELDLGTTQNQFYNSTWQQAATEGITVLVAAGDNGAAGCDNDGENSPAQLGLQVNGVASTPYNTAVGGTDFDYINSVTTYWNTTNSTSGTATTLSAKGLIPETAYNDSCTNFLIYQSLGFSNSFNACNSTAANNDGLLAPAGGSGGASSCTAPTGDSPSSCAGGYAKPTYQAGPGVPADGKRDLPDVSLFAGDGTLGSFYLECEEDLNPGDAACALTPQTISGEKTFTFNGVGGTSISAQAFAGIVAILDQKTGSQQGMGFNKQLYALAAAQSGGCANSSSTAPASTCIFYDTTSGTNSEPCVTGTVNCGTSVSSQLAPLARFKGAPRWTGTDLAILSLLVSTSIFLVFYRGRYRRLSFGFGLAVFALSLGVVGCGGGGGSSAPPSSTGTEPVGVLSGYNAVAGYDQATGLGSVNVTNLINASGWQ